MTISTGGGSGGGSCTQTNSITLNADTVNLVPEVVTTPTVANISLVLPNEEYSIPLPAGSRRFTLRARTATTIKLSYQVGMSGTTYLTLSPGASLTEDALATTTNYVLYIQSPQSGAVVELVSWA